MFANATTEGKLAVSLQQRFRPTIFVLLSLVCVFLIGHNYILSGADDGDQDKECGVHAISPFLIHLPECHSLVCLCNYPRNRHIHRSTSINPLFVNYLESWLVPFDSN